MFPCYWLMKRKTRNPPCSQWQEQESSSLICYNCNQASYGDLLNITCFRKMIFLQKKTVIILSNDCRKKIFQSKKLIWCPNGRLVIRLTYILVDRKVLRRQVEGEGAIWEGQQGLGGKPNPDSTCEGNVIKKQKKTFYWRGKVQAAKTSIFIKYQFALIWLEGMRKIIVC